jgi:hypothetical protein
MASSDERNNDSSQLELYDSVVTLQCKCSFAVVSCVPDNGSVPTNQSRDAAVWSQLMRYDAQGAPHQESHVSESLPFVPIDESPSLVVLLSDKIDVQAQVHYTTLDMAFTCVAVEG